MEFGNLKYLYYIIIPIIIFIVLIIGSKKRLYILEIFGWKKERNIVFFKSFFLLLGSILVFIALLSPEKRDANKKVEVKQNNVYLLIDVSKSMLATDVYPDRLIMVKREIKKILKKVKGDKIGIIPFSSSAYIQMPLTDDYSIINSYLDVLDTNLISGGGTNLYEALSIANQSFVNTKSEKKIVVIFSDGGDRDEKALNFAKMNKINVFSVGVGTNIGSVIKDENGYIKDKNGNVVVTKLNSSFLEELSSDTNGKYFTLNNSENNLSQLVNDINNLKKSKTEERDANSYIKYYQYPLALGFIFILLGYFLKRKEEK